MQTHAPADKADKSIKKYQGYRKMLIFFAARLA